MASFTRCSVMASSCAPALRRSLSSGSAAVAKRTTGVVGLDVEPAARATLMALYAKTLHDVRALLPEHAAYRKAVEHMTGVRLDIVRATPDVSTSAKDDELRLSAAVRSRALSP
jgi:hypothetical protein